MYQRQLKLSLLFSSMLLGLAILGPPVMAQKNAESVKNDQTLDKKVEQLDKKVEALAKDFAKKVEDLDKKFAGELSGLNNKISNLNWLYLLLIPLLGSLGLHVFQLIQSRGKSNIMDENSPKTPLVLEFSDDVKNDLKNFVKDICKEFQANRLSTERILQALLENQNSAIIERDRTNQQLEKKIEEIGRTLAQLQEEIKKINEKQVTPEQPTKDIQRYGIQEEVGIPEWPEVEVGIPEWPPVYPKDKNEQQLIEDYNKNNIKGRYGQLTEVSAVSGSIESTRGGSGDKPILTEQSPSKYWIIQDKYLVPQYLALDKSAMASVQNLFDCPGYQQGVSMAKDFTLQRTGKVQKVGDSWELVEKGVLDYNR